MLAAPMVRDFMREALADVPPIPFRAPPGMKLVRVNHKTGLPSSPGDKTAILEAFKPGEEPAGSVEEEMGDVPLAGGPPPDAVRAAPPGPAPAPRPRPMAPPPPPSNALTAGPGGLY